MRRTLPKASAATGVEMVILSTCNRLEFYVAAEAEAGDALLRSWFLHMQRLPHVDLGPHLNFYRDQSAVEHLLRVAGGLEPLTLGESHILDHLADALELARGCGMAGPLLSHLFEQAIRVGRQARVDLGLDGRTTFLRHAARRHFFQRHPELVQGNVLIVGAGRMAQLAAQVLQYGDTRPIAFVNRTAAHAEVLAQQAAGQIFPWHQMRTALAWADVVVTATAALHPILDADDIAAVLPQRRRRPLLLVDLGLPRNIHPAVAGMESIRCYDLKGLQTVLADLAQAELARAESPAPWVASLPVVQRMVQAETADLWAWLDRAMRPT